MLCVSCIFLLRMGLWPSRELSVADLILETL